MKLKDIRPNPNNPRIIRDARFEKLKRSIEQFPKMMNLRPIVVDASGVILGGNMRLRALQDLGFKEIPDEWVRRADDLTEEEKQRFIIADNVGFGEWDWDTLANEWDAGDLEAWGLDVPFESPESSIEEVDLIPFQQTHVLLSFSPQHLPEIQDWLQKIIDTGLVEYEQGNN